MPEHEFPPLRSSGEIAGEPILDVSRPRGVERIDKRIRVDHREVGVAVIERVIPLQLGARPILRKVKVLQIPKAVSRFDIVISERRK